MSRSKEKILELSSSLSGLESRYRLLVHHSEYIIEFTRSVFISVETLVDRDENV